MIHHEKECSATRIACQVVLQIYFVCYASCMKIVIDKRETKAATLPMIRVSTETKAGLEDAARASGANLSTLIRTVLERALAEGIEIG